MRKAKRREGAGVKGKNTVGSGDEGRCKKKIKRKKFKN